MYSSDFDSIFREEEEIQMGASLLSETEFTLLSVRNPGDSLWKEVRASYEFRKRTAERKTKIDQILKKIEEIIQMRKKNAAYLTSKLSDIKEIYLPEGPKNYRHIFQMYTIKVRDKKIRDSLKEYLNKYELKKGQKYY